MKFCSQCGGALHDRVPAGDDRQRRVCSACGHVHYQNPLVVVGCLVEHDDGILLCRRAIEPARGRWTAPAGFLEFGEALVTGAARETLEEAGADVEILGPHAFFDLTRIGQVYAWFRARLRGALAAPGHESLECGLFAPAAIPWDEIAFPAVHFALRFLLADRDARRPHLHHCELAWNGQGSRFDAANYDLRNHLRTPLAD